jgi:hypothetical protein
MGWMCLTISKKGMSNRRQTTKDREVVDLVECVEI